MERRELTAIFNEMLTKVYNEQQEKHKRKKKYDLQKYCCSEEEKNDFSAIFEELLVKKDNMNFERFKSYFQKEGE